MLYGYMAVTAFVLAMMLIVGLCLFAVRARECGMISRRRMWQIVAAIVLGIGFPLLLALIFWAPPPPPPVDPGLVEPVFNGLQ